MDRKKHCIIFPYLHLHHVLSNPLQSEALKPVYIDHHMMEMNAAGTSPVNECFASNKYNFIILNICKKSFNKIMTTMIKIVHFVHFLALVEKKYSIIRFLCIVAWFLCFLTIKSYSAKRQLTKKAIDALPSVAFVAKYEI